MNKPKCCPCPDCSGDSKLKRTVLNPEWVKILEKELEQAKKDRDEWLWCYSLVVGILEGNPGWETAKEYADFGSGLVPLRGATLAKQSRRSFWWVPRRTDPVKPGWYYVREITPKLCIGIRYFDDSKGTWWAFSQECKGLVPNESFHDWLAIENISDRQN